MNSSTDSVVKQIINGEPPASADDVHARLTSLDIAFTTQSHEPMRTVEQSKQFRRGATGGFSKNLFLRNKKGRMWLVTVDEDRAVDLKQLGQQLGAGRVSFASPERLMRYLGVIPGAVTPLAVINDVDNHVTAVIDHSLSLCDPVHFHPCDNTMTTTLGWQALLTFMRDCNHDPVVMDFDQPTLDQ